MTTQATRGPMGVNQSAPNQPHFARSVARNKTGTEHGQQDIFNFLSQFGLGPGARTEIKYPNNEWFSIVIYSSGIIEVQSGDWISKYTGFFTGSLTTGWDDFYRFKDGSYLSLENDDLIYTGEHIIYMPVFQRYLGENIIEGYKKKKLKKVVDDEVKRITIKKFVNLIPDITDVTKDVIADATTKARINITKANAIGTVAPVLFPTIAATATAVTALGVLGVAGPIAIAATQMITVAEYSNENLKVISMVASCYALAGFFLGKKIPTPNFSEFYKNSGKSSRGTQDAWNKGMEFTEEAIRNKALSMWTEQQQTGLAVDEKLLAAGLTKPSIEYGTYREEYNHSREQGIILFTEVLRQVYLSMNPNKSEQDIFKDCVKIQTQTYYDSQRNQSIQRMIDSFRNPGTLIWPCPHIWKLG